MPGKIQHMKFPIENPFFEKGGTLISQESNVRLRLIDWPCAQALTAVLQAAKVRSNFAAPLQSLR